MTPAVMGKKLAAEVDEPRKGPQWRPHAGIIEGLTELGCRKVSTQLQVRRPYKHVAICRDQHSVTTPLVKASKFGPMGDRILQEITPFQLPPC